MEGSRRRSTIEAQTAFSETDQQSERCEPELLWYKRLLSECCHAWDDVINLWQMRDCWSRFYAILSFITLPVCVIKRAASPQTNITIPDHASVCYLFVLTCFTLVINLVDLDRINSRRDIFVSGCMVLAIALMLYLYLFTKDRVRHDPCHYAPIRMFFRGGLYIFGFFSITNNICLAIDSWGCQPANEKEFDNKSAATVQMVQAIFVVTETLFLGYFHKACFPLDAMFLQISLAHLLGTNLALWFWILCEETESEPEPGRVLKIACRNSKRTPNLGWSAYQKYFYPVFVEYLILALAILYELWMNLRRRRERTLCRFCTHCASCLYRQNAVSEEQNNDENSSRRQLYIPRCSYGIIIGTIYTVVFFVLILLAISDPNNNRNNENRSSDTEHAINGTNILAANLDQHGPFIHYCYGSIVMYVSMICACYIILASLRSANNLQRIRSIDYDDVLLYISLMGMLLIEGFRVMSKIIIGGPYFYLVAVEITGIVQHLTQTVTLVNLGHYSGASDRRIGVWICECILFMLLTNLAWWVQSSFFLNSKLTRPGEFETIKGIQTYGIIVKPMVVFFRFHSATYFYNTWALNMV